MIGYIKGKIEDLTPSKTYIDVNGVGYEVHITLHTYELIKGMETCKVYVHLQIREDAWVMYGFAEEMEKAAFLQLLSVSGVGAATSRIILSTLSTNDLSRIIANGDNKSLEKVKGIGAKTAQRIILELRGKLAEPTMPNINMTSHNTIANDALNALVGLGIAKANAENAIDKVKMLEDYETYSVEQFIKIALKNL